GTAYDPAKDARTLFLSAVMKDATGACPVVNATNYTAAASTAFPTSGTSAGILNKKITLPLATTDDGKKISICYFVRDNSGNQSIPTSINWILDLTAPVAIASLDPMIAQNSSSKVTSVKLAVSTENGAVSYKAVLAAQSGCANVTYPTTSRTIDPANLQTFSISGSDGPRTLCIRAKDAAGNEQSINEPTIISWIRDTTAPGFNLMGAPTGTVTSASLNVSVSVTSVATGEAVAAWDYVLVNSTTCPTIGYGAKTSATKLDANNQTVANPITLTTTVDAGTTKTFGLCVHAYDAAGNMSAAKISSWTQKAP
ncbi:hypothetical protein EBR21_05060, partial [bacterium]|nr:hypothetical protein [bacterium]